MPEKLDVLVTCRDGGEDGIPPGALKLTIWHDQESQTTGVVLGQEPKWKSWSFVRMVLEEAVEIAKGVLQNQNARAQVDAMMQRHQEQQQLASLTQQLQGRRN